MPMIRDFSGDDKCQFDHHGGCQMHGYISLEPGEQCPHAEGQTWMKAYSERNPK